MVASEEPGHTPITQLGEEPDASRLVERMLVIVYDRQQSDHVTQGRIARLWVDDEEPDTLHIKLTGMMRYFPEPYDTGKGEWRYDEDGMRTLHLKEQGPRVTSFIHDPIIDEIIITQMDQGFKIKIPSPDTNHPQPEDILPAKSPQPRQ